MRWRWPNFERWEIACRHCGELVIHTDSLDALQALRNRLGPLTLNSAYRCAIHNAMEGGAPGSYHRYGRAFDIVLGEYRKDLIHKHARELGFAGFGLKYRTFIHIDTGPKRTW